MPWFAALPNALLFAATGLALFGIVAVLLFRALPGDLWTRAVKQSEVPAAIVVAALLLSLAWIIAAAVH